MFYFGNKILQCCDIPLLVHPKGSHRGWFLLPCPTGLVLEAGIAPQAPANPCRQRYPDGLCPEPTPGDFGGKLLLPRATQRKSWDQPEKPLTAMLSLMVCPSLKPRSSLGPCSRSWACRASSLCCLTHLQELNARKRRRHHPLQAPSDKSCSGSSPLPGSSSAKAAGVIRDLAEGAARG